MRSGAQPLMVSPANTNPLATTQRRKFVVRILPRKVRETIMGVCVVLVT